MSKTGNSLSIDLAINLNSANMNSVEKVTTNQVIYNISVSNLTKKCPFTRNNKSHAL